MGSAAGRRTVKTVVRSAPAIKFLRVARRPALLSSRSRLVRELLWPVAMRIPLASVSFGTFLLVGLTAALGGGCGSTSSGRPSCGDLETQYASALPAALTCDVNVAAGQCEQEVTGNLSPCSGCMISVNDATSLNAIRASWVQAGCNNVAVLCPASSCVGTMPGHCVAVDAGVGRCSDTPPATN